MRQAFLAAPELDLYVARPATEQAILAFEHALFERVGTVANLYGPPGIGKSMVLGRVAERLAGLSSCVLVEHSGLPVPDLCKWVLRELDTIAPQLEDDASLMGRIQGWFRRTPDELTDPEGALVARAAMLAAQGRPVVTLIDAADDLSPRAIKALAKLSSSAEGALFVGIASSSHAPDDRGPLATVELDTPMTLKETATYVDTRLARTGAPHALRAQLDADTIAQIHEYAEGNPRRVHGEISLIQIALEQEGAIRPDDPIVAPAPAPASSALGEPSRTPSALGPAVPPLRQTTRRAPVERPTSYARAAGVLLATGVAVILGWLVLSDDAPAPDETEIATATEAPAAAAPARPMPDVAGSGLASAEDEVREMTTLNVNAKPWATIFIDGEEIGVTPIGAHPIALGTYRIEAIMADGRTEEQIVEVDGPSAVSFE